MFQSGKRLVLAVTLFATLFSFSLIAGSAEGTLYVLAADAKTLTIEHTAVFEDELFATPAVLDGVVYVRTKSTLWAFGERRKE